MVEASVAGEAAPRPGDGDVQGYHLAVTPPWMVDLEARLLAVDPAVAKAALLLVRTSVERDRDRGCLTVDRAIPTGRWGDLPARFDVQEVRSHYE